MSQQTLRHSSNSQPHVEAETCPCCGQAITTKQQVAKIQEWRDGTMRDATAKAQEQLARDREAIKADAFKKGQAANQAVNQKELTEAKRQQAAAEQKATEALKQVETAQAKAEKIAEAKIEKHQAEADKARAKEKEEHNKLIDSLQTQVRNLERGLEKKSAHERGNPAEVDMLAALQAAFAKTDDRITGKSGRGGDATQCVRNKNRDCGKVIFESKDTKKWVPAHVDKLLKDKRDAEAEHAVLCVATLRDDMPDGQLVHETDGVFVVRHKNVVTLARMIRDFMVKLATAQIASAERANMHHKFYELIMSESGQHALRTVPESIESLREIDSRQLNYTKDRNKERQKIYDAQQAAFEPFTAAIDAILSGDDDH